ncbi:MAG: adenine phosphoribosyltransferase, partial [Sulfuricurvum sp.]|nr:adenine phosphoribosyltransferase [Sulfuricurvum sp.]
MTLSIQDKAVLINAIRDIPDFPKPGIIFKDITTLLADKDAFKVLMNHLAERYSGYNLTHIAGIDARGFIFGAALAQMLGVGFV